MQDYILNARPRSESPEVFCAWLPPGRGWRMRSALDVCFAIPRKAGIYRHALMGKGSTDSRRLAKKLLVTGTPLTTITQILGHDDPKSARQYLSLDTRNLKECALDFKGIPLERGLEG